VGHGPSFQGSIDVGIPVKYLNFSQSGECINREFLLNLSFDAHLINRSHNKRTNCIRKNFIFFLTRIYLFI